MKYLVIGISIGALVTQTHANIVFNGGFESPQLSAATDPVGWHNYSAGQSFGGWTVQSGSVDLVSDGYGQSPRYGLEAWPAPEGHQSVDLNGYQRGAIYQDLATTPGQNYRLSFALSGNPIGPDLAVIVSSYWGDQLVQTISYVARSPMAWTYYDFGVTSQGDRTRITFASQIDWVRGPALDDVSVEPVSAPGGGSETTPVPEPSTWIAGALVAIPFGLQCLRGLRSRRSLR